MTMQRLARGCFDDVIGPIGKTGIGGSYRSNVGNRAQGKDEREANEVRNDGRPAVTLLVSRVKILPLCPETFTPGETKRVRQI